MHVNKPDGESTNGGMSTSRIEAFSDGVFAIAITLLVLEIRVPHIPEAASSVELLHQLLALWPKFLSYATSFLVIGIYWVAHHTAFHYTRRSDRLLVWINILFLMCLSFLPFPTAVIGEYGREPVAVAFYGVALLVTAIVFNFMWRYIIHNRRLLHQDVNQHQIDLAAKGGLIGLPLYVLAIVFAFISIPVSILIYVLVPIFYIFLNIKWTRG